jgi:hypothetical protein
MEIAGFKRVVRESGLTKIELAELYETSRQTIHAWWSVGPPREGTLLARQADVITRALINSIEGGLLPFPAMVKEARRARIARMAATLHKLRPAPK